MRQLEKMLLLTTIDTLWKDHLLAMDHLREGIGLQGYGQKDPLIEYKKQGFQFFEMMMNQITGDVVRKAFTVQLAQRPDAQGAAPDSHEMEAEIEAELEKAEAHQTMQYNLAPDGSLVSREGALPLAVGGVRRRRARRRLRAPLRCRSNNNSSSRSTT